MNEWTEVQWQLFKNAYEHEIEDSRLADKVIPAYQLPSSARAVETDQYDYGTKAVDDINQIPLEERQEPFSLTLAQAEDEDLSSAQVIVRRAAQRLARGDDDRVFAAGIRKPIADNAGNANYHDIVPVRRILDPNGGLTGDGLLEATAAAVAKLDGDGYRSGFVMVAGSYLYQLLYARAPGAADLPVVAVRGLLENGPVHRSTSLLGHEALVLSVGAGRIDRAVAVSPVAEFLRVEQIPDPRDPANLTIQLRQWRLYGRFITRFKETRSAVLLQLE